MFYYPKGRSDTKLWAQNFKTQIAIVGPQLRETAESLAHVQSNMDALIAAIDSVEQAKLELQRLTTILNNTDKSIGKDTRDFVQRIKTSPFYRQEMGNVLQIISTTPIVDLTKHQPVLTAKQTGSTVHLSFKKHGADGMNIYERLMGETDLRLLTNAKKTPYIDARPLAKANTPEVREYCAIATLGNVEVGRRSEIISIKFNG